MVAAGATAAALAACGGQTQASGTPAGRYPVAVAAAFPTSQTLAQHARLVVAVRNAGHRTLPNVAVTICNVTCRYPAPAGTGVSAQPFGNVSSQAFLANPSQAVWVVDRPPGVCSYSCRNGGAGAAVTVANNTWALGRLLPGHTARFVWGLTAVQPGRHVVAWAVSAGIYGRARAVLAVGGGTPHGRFTVAIGNRPPQTYVNNNGRIVTASP